MATLRNKSFRGKKSSRRHEEKPTRATSWGGVAEWYDSMVHSKDSYQHTVILPNLVRLIGDMKGTLVDLACGSGFFAHAFAEKGIHVIGVDIGKELIEVAQRKPAGKPIQFITAPAHDVSQIPPNSVDRVVIVLALQNIADIGPVIAECARMLKVDGVIHVVLNHPAFRIPKASQWGWDMRAGVQYRRVDKYLSETKMPIQMHPGDAPAQTTLSFHRPLQSYVKALRAQRFAVTSIEEWISPKVSDSGPRAPLENTARKEFPLFLYMEARRL